MADGLTKVGGREASEVSEMDKEKRSKGRCGEGGGNRI